MIAAAMAAAIYFIYANYKLYFGEKGEKNEGFT